MPNADPALRDELINILSPHSAGCQDTTRGMRDAATQRADQVLTAVAEHLNNQGHYHAAEHLGFDPHTRTTA